MPLIVRQPHQGQKNRLWALTWARWGPPAAQEQHGKYTGTVCCWAADWPPAGYTSTRAQYGIHSKEVWQGGPFITQDRKFPRAGLLLFCGNTYYLGSFPFLHAHTVEALDEVVQHLSLLTCLNGKAVTARVSSQSSTRCAQATEKRKEGDDYKQ